MDGKMTDTKDLFKEELKDFKKKLDASELSYKDGIKLFNRAYNLFLRYEQIRTSRDKWRKKYEELKQSI